MFQAAVFTHADGKFPFCLADKQASAHTHIQRGNTLRGRRVSFSEKPVSTYLLRISYESYERLLHTGKQTRIQYFFF